MFKIYQVEDLHICRIKYTCEVGNYIFRDIRLVITKLKDTSKVQTPFQYLKGLSVLQNAFKDSFAVKEDIAEIQNVSWLFEESLHGLGYFTSLDSPRLQLS